MLRARLPLELARCTIGNGLVKHLSMRALLSKVARQKAVVALEHVSGISSFDVLLIDGHTQEHSVELSLRGDWPSDELVMERVVRVNASDLHEEVNLIDNLTIHKVGWHDAVDLGLHVGATPPILNNILVRTCHAMAKQLAPGLMLQAGVIVGVLGLDCFPEGEDAATLMTGNQVGVLYV